MPNDQFRFKQFTISQTGTTLKVCTDSCLFGAWVASHLTGSKKALDIGTGTGLLALMYAQQHSDSMVSALEIDSISAELARRNFEHSPWAENLQVENCSVQEFAGKTPNGIFDEIFCNPPFFENQLFSSNKTKNLAKHSSQLSKQELVDAISKLRAEKGSAYILLPEFEAADFVLVAKDSGLYLTEQMTVRNKIAGNVFRQMMCFQKEEKELEQTEIVIYESEKVYTTDFIKMLKPYYLYL